MPGLRELQRSFLAAILHGDGHALEALVCGDAPDARARIGIYRNNAFASLSAALAAVFPVVERLVGPPCFGGVARRFVRAHPSRSGNLHDFGDAFPDFLARDAIVVALPYLPDVARLEWAWHHAFHAAAAPEFPFAALAEVAARDQAGLRFHLAPSATLLASPYPAASIWHANQAPPGHEPPVDLGTGAEHTVVARTGIRVRIQRVCAAEHALLAALDAGHPLGAAIDAAQAMAPDANAAAWLNNHVGAGVITGFTL